MWATRFKLRIFVAAVIGTIALVCFGIGELSRCVRTLFGAPSVTMAEVVSGGLGKYGYVRITGVRAAMDRATIVGKKDKRSGEETWTGAYVPIIDAASKEDGQCNVLAWLPQAREEHDLLEFAATGGAVVEDEEDAGSSANAASSGGEIVGFVKYDYNGMNPGEQQQVAGLARVKVRNCWVVDVSSPSWIKGLGMVLGGLAIPGVFALWKMKYPG